MQLEDLSLDQLLELERLIGERIDELRAQQAFDILRQLRLGQQVHFETRQGLVFGQVIKINRKTVVIETEDYQRWKVPVGLVTPLKNCD